jgi:hypothetical protein
MVRMRPVQMLPRLDEDGGLALIYTRCFLFQVNFSEALSLHVDLRFYRQASGFQRTSKLIQDSLFVDPIRSSPRHRNRFLVRYAGLDRADPECSQFFSGVERLKA